MCQRKKINWRRQEKETSRGRGRNKQWLRGFSVKHEIRTGAFQENKHTHRHTQTCVHAHKSNSKIQTEIFKTKSQHKQKKSFKNLFKKKKSLTLGNNYWQLFSFLFFFPPEAIPQSVNSRAWSPCYQYQIGADQRLLIANILTTRRHFETLRLSVFGMTLNKAEAQ